MNQKLWDTVDDYYRDLFVLSDSRFENILRRSELAELPAIQVSPAQGRLLELLVRIQGAKRILEVGTLGGYSTAWLASGMPPGGELVSLEIEPAYAALARENLSAFEFHDVIDIRVGDAVESIRVLVDSQAKPFDLIFLDADKTQYCDYLDGVLQLTRQGSVIIADNIVRDGQIIEPDCDDPRVQGVRSFNMKIAENDALRCTAIQTVGSKGYDGFAMIYVAD